MPPVQRTGLSVHPTLCHSDFWEVNTTFLQLKCDKGPLYLEPCDEVKGGKETAPCVITALLAAI